MPATTESVSPGGATPGKRYVRVVGPRLRILLCFIFGLVALLGANSAYLASITFLEWFNRAAGVTFQNYFYQYMFLAHLALGLVLVLPFVVFGILHIKNAHDRPNRRAVKVGYLLFSTSLVVLVTGLLLTRIDIFQFKNVGLRNPQLRSAAYWAHVITPVLAVWLYLLHRLAGPRIHWQVGIRWAAAVGLIVLGMVFLHSKHPRKNPIGSVEGKKYFEPSLARTATGNFIPARTLMMDAYCLKCHEDAYQGWFHSAHHFSSFNNQPYLFSVRETRKVGRDGYVQYERAWYGVSWAWAGREVQVEAGVATVQLWAGEQRLAVHPRASRAGQRFTAPGQWADLPTADGRPRREALAVQQKLLGNEHPDLATTLGNLGTALRDQAKLAEAEALYRQSSAMLCTIASPRPTPA